MHLLVNILNKYIALQVPDFKLHFHYGQNKLR